MSSTRSNRRHSFIRKVLAAAMLVVLGDQLFYAETLYGPRVGWFALAWAIATITAVRAIRHDRRALAVGGIAILLAGLLIEDSSLLGWTLFGVALASAVLLPRTAAFDDAWRWAQRLLLVGLCAIAGPARDLLRWSRVRRGSERAPIARFVPLLALPLVGCIIFITLFASANPLIADLLACISLPAFDLSTIGRMLVWVLLGTLAWTTLRPRRVSPFLPSIAPSGATSLPGVSIASVTLSLLLFNGVFALQNGLDVAFLWSGAPLTGGRTFASYAHQGAYPLIATALLAGLFVLVTLRPGTATAGDPRIRRLVLLWIAQNVLLVASSILRTLDYIDAYSLTRLRIAALAWMLLVAIGLMLICWRLFRDRSGAWLINANAVAASMVLAVASVVDLGAVAAAWNVRHAREVGGRGNHLDLCYLNELGPSALVSLTELIEVTPPSTYADRLRFVRNDLLRRTIDEQTTDWSWRNDRRLQRARAVLPIQPVPTPAGYWRDCDGSLKSATSLTTEVAR